LHEADGVRDTPMATANDQLIPIEVDFVDELLNDNAATSAGRASVMNGNRQGDGR
jgi:hypothetical protein